MEERIFSTTVSRDFSAAHCFDRLLARLVEAHLQESYLKALKRCRTEAQEGRARLMRRSPLDYPAVRQLDYQLDDISRLMQELETARRRR